MTVTHLSKVVNFDSVLASGGIHSFQITLDEMPELEGIEGGVKIKCFHSDCGGVWIGIVNRIAERGGYCVYKKSKSGSLYEVVCVIPPPS